MEPRFCRECHAAFAMGELRFPACSSLGSQGFRTLVLGVRMLRQYGFRTEVSREVRVS